MYTPRVVFLCICGCLGAAQEFLLNPGFENGVTYWTHDGFNMQTDFQEVHEGIASVKCTKRTQAGQGPAQNVNLTIGNRYAFSSYIKLIDDMQVLAPQILMVKIAIDYVDTGTDNFEVTTRLHVTPKDGWVLLESYFMFPNKPYTTARLFVEGPAPEVSFYFDDVSLKLIPEDYTWETDADNRIEQLRKSNIQFQFNVAPNFNIGELEVQMNQTSHLFPFGSMLRSEYVIDPDYTQYQNIAYHMFNWATLQEYKWRQESWDSSSDNFTIPIIATEKLIQNGLKVRGHCLFWAVQGHEPDWVSPLTGQAMKDAVYGHIKNMTDLTKGNCFVQCPRLTGFYNERLFPDFLTRLSHWVVNNELLHGSFYEDSSGDPNITQNMFHAVHVLDPVPGLFLNDYDVVAGGMHTAEYLDLVQKFKAANVELAGIGVQSRFQDLTEPDITLIKARLDRLAQADIPIWITELSITSHNESQRADWYEKVLRLYFSHPSVEGIMLWGFWDHDSNPLQALVHGNSYTLDESGKRFLQLTKQEWSTQITRSLSAGTSFLFRGFLGDYDLLVLYNGKIIKRVPFTLSKNVSTISIDIDGDGSEIQLPPVVDPFQHVDINFDSTSQNLQTLGSIATSSQNQEFQCVTRMSELSEVGDDISISVGCEGGDILTGCSSYLENNDWRRDGEQIDFSSGQPVCRAFNGFQSTVGTKAIARCCSVSGLQCQYKNAGPSGTGVNDQVEVPCASSEYPLGCGTWTYQSESDGTVFATEMCVGQNDDPKEGVYSFAACCQAPGLLCVVMYSQPSAQYPGDQATVQCPAGAGFIMTGCNVYSPNGRAAGAFIEEIGGVDTCIAVNGYQKYGQDTGVQATAACCKIQ